MDTRRFYDVIIVGGGPAGLTAALYLARACYRVLVIEKESFGGQITITEEVVNYPGVARTSGKALTETMRQQAEHFGAEFLLGEVTALSLAGDLKTVTTDKGDYTCFGVLLATGAHPRQLGFAGEQEFRGHGVAYCATCDGEFFTGKQVFVVGGGFAAAEESVFLTKYASHVTLLIREDDFTCAKSTADATRAHPNITVLTNVEVVEVTGDSVPRRICYKNNKTGEQTVWQAPDGDTFGVFVFAGYVPATALVRDKVALDAQGYVIADCSGQTNVEGVFAAGDVRAKNLRQVVTAVGDGGAAATELEKYASQMQAKTGLIPDRPIKRALSEDKPAPVPAQTEVQEGVFSAEIVAQLQTVFAKMEQPLVLKLSLDDRHASDELRAYMTELTKYTDKLTIEIDQSEREEHRPCVRLTRADGTPTGLAFHGVPGGHEFTSFVLGLYNAAGPGQPLDESTRTRIAAIDREVSMQVLVSLSCTMCPELVTAAQRIAALQPKVKAEVYDLNHFPSLRERYEVMSVPCLVLNEDKVMFGKKNIAQLLDQIEAL